MAITRRRNVRSYTRRRKSPPVTFAKKAVAKAVRKAKAKNLTSFVKRVISRQTEHKVAIFQQGFGIGGYFASFGNQIAALTPYNSVGLTIAQGTGQGDRVGDRIRTVKAVLRYTIYPNAYHATINPVPTPQNVRIWFFGQKSSNTLLATNPPNFAQTGDSSTTLTGTILDLNRVVNRDVYTYYGHRTHKLGYSINQASGAATSNAQFANNDYKLNIQGYVDLTKWFPKLIKYNDTDQNPNSKLIMMLVESVNADGSAQTTVGVTPANINYQITYTFSDA